MVNRQVRNPGQLAEFNATGRVSTDIPSAAIYKGQAFDALAQVAGQLSGRLGKMADAAAQREGQMAGLTAGQMSGAAYLRQQAVQAEAASVSTDIDIHGPAEEQAKALLRKEEGFRDTPYWDTNAWRVGYGSDTTTLADGRTVKVTKGMKITRADAERDFLHRLGNVEGKRARDQVGDAWSKLPANAQAALYSLAYNYGSLPKNVVAAAKTGDLNQLSSAVSSLPANAQRRKREAALILAKGAAPAADGKEPSKEIAPVNADQQPVLQTTPLALRNDGTIRGDAFDGAAMRSYAWRMQAGLSSDLNTAYEQNKDDPAAFNKAVGQVRDTYLKDENFSDPRMREIFDQAFAEKSAAYSRDVATRQEGKLRQEEQASFAAALSAQSVELERQSMVLGASKDGDKLVQTQLDKVIGNIDMAERAGTISPAAALKMRMDAEETAVRGRIQGVYEALPTPERKREFALSVLEDWKTGEGPLAKLPYDTVKGISNTLFADATRLTEEQKSAIATEKARVKTAIDDDVASLEHTGQGLDPEKAGLDPSHVRDLLTAQEYAKWQDDREKAQKLYQATAGMDTQTPEDIEARADMLKPQPGQPGFEQAQKVYDAVRAKQTQILKDRVADPLAEAKRSGVLDIAPIDTSTPDAMAQSLNTRAAQARQLSRIYQMDVPLFSKQEVKVFKASVSSLDPVKYQATMEQVDFAVNQSGINQVEADMGKDVADAVQDWQAKVKFFTPDEVKEWLRQKSDPAYEERVKPLRSKGRTEAAKVSFDDLVENFDGWIFDPQNPPDNLTRDALMNDFTALMGDRFAATSDPATAKAQAIERVKQVWGVTTSLGDSGGRLMANPPEKYYPAIAGTHDYMRQDLEAVAKEKGVSLDSLSLVADVKTRQAVNGKKLPGYLIAVAGADGATDILRDDRGRPLRMFFDVEGALHAAAKNAYEQRRTRNDPWLVLGPDFPIGPFYGFGGADPADNAMTLRRAKEIYQQQTKDHARRRLMMKNSKEQLDRLGVPGELPGGN